ncbi:hypothetical protein ACJX0J_014136 [Zea mays]
MGFKLLQEIGKMAEAFQMHNAMAANELLHEILLQEMLDKGIKPTIVTYNSTTEIYKGMRSRDKKFVEARELNIILAGYVMLASSGLCLHAYLNWLQIIKALEDNMHCEFIAFLVFFYINEDNYHTNISDRRTFICLILCMFIGFIQSVLFFLSGDITHWNFLLFT